MLPGAPSYQTCRFIFLFTEACQRSLSWNTSQDLHTTSSHTALLRLTSCTCLPSALSPRLAGRCNVLRRSSVRILALHKLCRMRRLLMFSIPQRSCWVGISIGHDRVLSNALQLMSHPMTGHCVDSTVLPAPRLLATIRAGHLPEI
jgi:hypothetical protein